MEDKTPVVRFRYSYTDLVEREVNLEIMPVAFVNTGSKVLGSLAVFIGGSFSLLFTWLLSSPSLRRVGLPWVWC